MCRGEVFNSITHLVGSVLAAAGLVTLVCIGAREGDPWRMASFVVYGVTLVALYLFSTLYHSLKGRGKAFFRKLDHTSIYLLIAGTYTPFAMNPLRGPVGYALLAVVWLLAAVGVLQEFLRKRRRRALSVSIYVLMGWLALAVVGPLARVLGLLGLALLFCGGILYTVGIVFYVLDEKMAHSHGIFHLFVLGGSVAHFLVVFFYVA
jgi:hemolysin III